MAFKLFRRRPGRVPGGPNKPPVPPLLRPGSCSETGRPSAAESAAQDCSRQLASCAASTNLGRTTWRSNGGPLDHGGGLDLHAAGLTWALVQDYFEVGASLA
jgi:hypothetical protein